MDQDSLIDALLGDNVGAHGTELRLRDADDGTADLHETSSPLLYQGCECYFTIFSRNFTYFKNFFSICSINMMVLSDCVKYLFFVYVLTTNFYFYEFIFPKSFCNIF